MANVNDPPPWSNEAVAEFEEKNVLSKRRVVAFIFLVGLLVIALMFLIRVDIGTKRTGTYMKIVEKTSPVSLGSVEAAVSGGKEDASSMNDRSTYIYYQRHPKELLGRLFG